MLDARWSLLREWPLPLTEDGTVLAADIEGALAVRNRTLEA